MEGEDEVLDKIRDKGGDYIEMLTPVFRVQVARGISAGQKKRKNPSAPGYKLGMGVREGVSLVHRIHPVGYGGSIVFFYLIYNRYLFLAISAFTESFILASDNTSQRALDPQSRYSRLGIYQLCHFVGFILSKPSLARLLAISGNTNSMLDNRTALHEPTHWAWLPNNASLRGFEDWFAADKEHYRASEESLKLSNLDDNLLPPLREI